MDPSYADALAEREVVASTPGRLLGLGSDRQGEARAEGVTEHAEMTAEGGAEG